MENMKEDLEKVDKIVKTNNLDKIVRSGGDYDTHLSEKAIKNLLEFYKKSDYAALKALMEFGFITKELYKDYHKI